MTAKKPTRTPKAKSPSLKVERIFEASPKTLWSYWTDPKKFAKWFNPAPGMDLVVHVYRVRVGGRIRFDMPQPDGNPNPQEGVFHVVDPYRELVSGAPDKSFLITVKFAAVGKRTRMTVLVTGIPPRFHEGATRGWNAGFDKLAGLLGGSAVKPLVLERTFRAPIEKLWALWTTKAGIESWWGPEGFTTSVDRLELRPGGPFDYTMTAVGPEQVAALKEMRMPLTTTARNTYTKVEAPQRLGYKTIVDFVPGIPSYEIEAEVQFREVRGRTRMIFTSSKMHDPGFQEMARQGQISQLEKLARIVQAESARGKDETLTLSMPSPREVVVTRLFDAPPARVYEAHVDPKAIEEWWGPQEYTNRVEVWEVRKGGAWRIVQRTPDGTAHAFHGIFQEIVPPRRLAWTFEYEGTPGHVITETVTFAGQPGGTTKLTVRALYANREDRDTMLASGMEWGMREGYAQLDALLRR